MEGQLVSTPTEIHETLRQIQPVRIAVAFVGKNWRSYIDAKNLSEIVLSPTIGSNPKAIEELGNEIGWGNVYFLDKLHSKIYIGETCALMGSCNLTDNGIGGGLEEMAIFLKEKRHLDQLHKAIDDYKELAQKMYPDKSSKLARLRELIQLRKEMPRYYLPGEYGKTAPDVNNYTLNLNDRIHIAYYEGGKILLNEERVRGNSDVPPTQNVDDYYTDCMQFCNDDQIENKDWILCWKCKNGIPSGSIQWMYVDEVIDSGCEDDEYPKLVAQVKKSIPTPPFKLDPKTIKRIRVAIASDEFKILRPHDGDEIWKLEPADKVVPKFIEVIKQT